MHTIIVDIIKNVFGNDLKPNPANNIWNIYPSHIPAGAINPIFSKAIIYSFTTVQRNLTAKLYNIQFTVVGKDYDVCRTMANTLDDTFNKMTWNVGTYPVATTGLISTTTDNILDGGYDTETGMYMIYVNIIAKGTI